MAIQESELTEASARLAAAMKACDEATRVANLAAAEAARLTLLKFADKDDDLIGMSFEVNSEYDDEGSYFKCASVYPQFESGEDVDHEVSDELNAFGPAALCVLCGVHDESWEGEITIAEARERRF